MFWPLLGMPALGLGQDVNGFRPKANRDRRTLTRWRTSRNRSGLNGLQVQVPKDYAIHYLFIILHIEIVLLGKL